MPAIEGSAKTVAFDVKAFLSRGDAPMKTVPKMAVEMKADPWVHYQWGGYSIINLPAPLSMCALCCGWPFPCVCCCPGCAMPCGFSCCPSEGKGPSQCLDMMIIKGQGPPQYGHLRQKGKGGAPPTPAMVR